MKISIGCIVVACAGAVLTTQPAAAQCPASASPIADEAPCFDPSPEYPWGQQAHGTSHRDRLYVTLPDRGEIAVIDPRARHVVATWSVEPAGAGGARPRYRLAGSPDERRLAVLDSAGHLALLDARTGKKIATRRLGGEAVAAAFTLDGRSLWVGKGDGTGIDVLDAGTLAPKKTLSFAQPIADIAVAPGSGDVLVCSASGQPAEMFDPHGRIVTRVTQRGKPCKTLAASPDGRRWWMASADGAITTVDPTGRASPLGTGTMASGPDSLAFATNAFGQVGYACDSRGLRAYFEDGKHWGGGRLRQSGCAAMWPSGDGAHVYAIPATKAGILVLDADLKGRSRLIDLPDRAGQALYMPRVGHSVAAG